MPDRHRELNAQLDAYSAAENSSLATPARTRLDSRWPVYAAAAASTLAYATNASASIIYSGVQNVSTAAPHVTGSGNRLAGTAKIHIGLDRLTLRASSIIRPQSFGGIAAVLAPSVRFLSNGSSAIKALASGAVISSLNFPSKPAFGILSYKSTSSRGSQGQGGTFQPGNAAFAGLMLGFPTTSGQTDWHFGWIRLSFENSARGYPDQVTAIDWAYNSVALAPILAGQTATVPEPGDMSLALLAAGSAGVLAWRRRRSAGSQ